MNSLIALGIRDIIRTITEDDWKKSNIRKSVDVVELIINNFGSTIQIIARDPETKGPIDLKDVNFILVSDSPNGKPMAWISKFSKTSNDTHYFDKLPEDLQIQELHLSSSAGIISLSWNVNNGTKRVLTAFQEVRDIAIEVTLYNTLPGSGIEIKANKIGKSFVHTDKLHFITSFMEPNSELPLGIHYGSIASEDANGLSHFSYRENNASILEPTNKIYVLFWIE